MKLNTKTGVFTWFVGLLSLIVLAANAQQVVESPLDAAQETLKIAYASALGDEYAVHREDLPVEIKVLEHPGTQNASVLLNNTEVMKYRAAYDGLSPILRARRTASRLYAFLSDGGDPKLIKPDQEGGQVVIRIGEEVLAEVDPETAQQSHNSVSHLALVWTNLTRKALRVTPLPLLRQASEAAVDKLKTVTSAGSTNPALLQPTGKQFKGMASWYGPGFHGRRAANGSRFNMYELTAAHRTLPFGTLVRVSNDRTGKNCIVRITDRGPFSHNRIIDLSKAAAQAIGLLSSGVAPVRLDVLAKAAQQPVPAKVQPVTPSIDGNQLAESVVKIDENPVAPNLKPSPATAAGPAQIPTQIPVQAKTASDTASVMAKLPGIKGEQEAFATPAVAEERQEDQQPVNTILQTSNIRLLQKPAPEPTTPSLD